MRRARFPSSGKVSIHLSAIHFACLPEPQTFIAEMRLCGCLARDAGLALSQKSASCQQDEEHPHLLKYPGPPNAGPCTHSLTSQSDGTLKWRRHVFLSSCQSGLFMLHGHEEGPAYAQGCATEFRKAQGLSATTSLQASRMKYMKRLSLEEIQPKAILCMR